MKSLRPNMPHFDLLARAIILLDQPLAFASSIKQQMQNWQAQGAFANNFLAVGRLITASQSLHRQSVLP